MDLRGTHSGTRAASERIAQLDTLRGIAVLLVFAHHVLIGYVNRRNGEYGVGEVVDFGRTGVVVFFLISGFVIVRTVHDSSVRAAGLFWTHRFFRLFPAYWLAVGVAGFLSVMGLPRVTALAKSVSPSDFLANLTMVPGLFGGHFAIGAFWTLQIELIFYVLISLAIMIWPISRRVYAGFAFGLFALSLAYAGMLVVLQRSAGLSTDNIYLGLLHLSIMFCGAGLRLHWDQRNGAARGFILTMPAELKLYFASVTGFLLAYTALKLKSDFDIHTFRAIGSYTLAFAIFLLGVERLGFSRVGKFLGDRSYSFYLLHMPIIAVCYALTISAAGHPIISQAVFAALTFAISLAASSLMYRFVERPSTRLGHRLRPSASLRAASQLNA